MSPGGLMSADADAGGGPAAPDELFDELLDDEPQPAHRRAAAPATVRTRRGVMRRPSHPPVKRGPGVGQRRVKLRRDRRRSGYGARVDRSAILVVEDDDALASGLVRVLESQGFTARRLARGAGAAEAATDEVGLAIVDLGLPDVDGIVVCRRLRARRRDLAILILSARDQELDVVAGLDAGADDYLVKPFRLAELLARVRAHLRRAAAAPGPDLPEPDRAGDITVDRAARRAWREHRELALRPKEFDLLA